MALTWNGVRKARAIIEQLSDIESLRELEDILTIMNTDPDFSKFTSETNFGQEMYEKWQKLVSLISEELYYSVNDMTNGTRNFIEKQVELNKVIDSNNGPLGGPHCVPSKY